MRVNKQAVLLCGGLFVALCSIFAAPPQEYRGVASQPFGLMVATVAASPKSMADEQEIPKCACEDKFCYFLVEPDTVAGVTHEQALALESRFQDNDVTFRGNGSKVYLLKVRTENGQTVTEVRTSRCKTKNGSVVSLERSASGKDLYDSMTRLTQLLLQEWPKVFD